MSTKDNQSALRLSPSHGKHVFALAVIAAVHDKTLIAENVETLQNDEKEQITKAMKQEMMLVTRLLQHTSNGSFIEWNETTSPLASSRCRALGKSPTGPDLDAMDINVTNKHEPTEQISICLSVFLLLFLIPLHPHFSGVLLVSGHFLELVHLFFKMLD